jgi:hypothetical protein
VSNGWDDEDRAIARALDAAPDAETTGADELLVEEYRSVLGEIPVPELTPPPALEERVVAAALERRAANAVALPTADRRTRRLNRFRIAALSAAIVAAAVVAGLIVRDGSSGPSTPGGRVALATQEHGNFEALVRSPGARTGVFGGGNGRVVIARNGDSAVYDLAGGAPGSITIGLVSAGGTTTLGPAQPSGRSIAFVVDHPERVTAVTLTRNGVELARAIVTPR